MEESAWQTCSEQYDRGCGKRKTDAWKHAERTAWLPRGATETPTEVTTLGLGLKEKQGLARTGRRALQEREEALTKPALHSCSPWTLKDFQSP